MHEPAGLFFGSPTFLAGRVRARFIIDFTQTGSGRLANYSAPRRSLGNRVQVHPQAARLMATPRPPQHDERRLRSLRRGRAGAGMVGTFRGGQTTGQGKMGWVGTGRTATDEENPQGGAGGSGREYGRDER